MMKENEAIRSNKQNHPSFESKFKPQKPSIKVDYKVIHSTQTLEKAKKKQGKKQFALKINNNTSLLNASNATQEFFSVKDYVSRVKSVEGSQKQYQSGRFVESEYCTNDESRMTQSRNTYSKGKVEDARSRYQHSKSVENMIRQQFAHKKREPSCFVSKSRTQREFTEPSAMPDYISRIKNSKITFTSRVSQKNKLPSYSSEGIKDIMEYEHAGKYRAEKVTPKCGTVQNEKVVKDRFKSLNEIHEFDFRKRMNTLSNEVRLTKGLR